MASDQICERQSVHDQHPFYQPLIHAGVAAHKDLVDH